MKKLLSVCLPICHLAMPASEKMRLACWLAADHKVKFTDVKPICVTLVVYQFMLPDLRSIVIDTPSDAPASSKRRSWKSDPALPVLSAALLPTTTAQRLSPAT